MIKKQINTYCVAIAFALFLCFLCVEFHKDMFGLRVGISALWKHPVSFIKYYWGTMLLPLFISSFVLITKRYWWTILVAFLMTIWVIANLMYYSFCDALLDWQSVLLVGNMSGAWSSIIVLWTNTMTMLVSGFVVYLLILFALSWRNKNKSASSIASFSLWGALVVILLCLQIVHNAKIYKSETLLFPYQLVDAEDAHIVPKLPKWMPLGVVVNTAQCSPIRTYPKWKNYYIEKQSIISYLLAMPIYECFLPSHKVESVAKSDASYKEMLAYLNYENGMLLRDFIPVRSLCILLIESLESWPILNNFEGREITPNLNRLVHNKHVLYCSKMKSQIRRGNSADGQMMLNSGLLPLEDGVACMQYGDNIYPNFAHCFESSLIVNPWPNIWNQDVMTKRYGYRTVIEPVGGVKESWEDDVVMTKAMSWMKECETDFCTMVITQSMHVPFNHVTTADFASINSNMTPSLVNYIKSVHWCDSCIGAFLDCWMADDKLSNSMLLITGDHTILDRVAFQQGSSLPKELIEYAPDGLYVPFIVYTPDIERNNMQEEQCYQMDMFPTILALNGGETYMWQGFGKNLLNSDERMKDEVECFRISDRMIKTNFFDTLEDEK